MNLKLELKFIKAKITTNHDYSYLLRYSNDNRCPAKSLSLHALYPATILASFHASNILFVNVILLCLALHDFFRLSTLSCFLFRPELARLPPCVLPDVDAILDITNLKKSARRFQVCYAQKRCARDDTAPLSYYSDWLRYVFLQTSDIRLTFLSACY